MSYNGSGTFNINTAGQPVVSGTVISSTAFNLLTTDLATGLSTALTKDGQTTPTANIKLGNFKLTGVGNPTATGDALNFNGPLGTPFSGTVTNLTGTASININGTVGATTPSTVDATQFTASSDSAFNSTGAVQISKGTTAQRPTGVAGKLRFNSDTAQFEGYSGSAWTAVGGGATGAGGNTIFQENSTVMTASYTISTGKNAMLVGPLTMNSGVTLTIPSGQRVLIF